jgi:L-threonylcarbamoyladenylate synthase
MRRSMEMLEISEAHPDAPLIQRAAACLRRGGLVAFPTETVYGLGAHALDPRAVARVFAAKGRPLTDPLIVHVARVEDVRPLVRALPASAERLAARFWPGPLTLVLPRSSRVPDLVTAGLETVAVRVPAHPVARALLQAADLPVAAPSANLFSRPSPTRAAHVRDDLGDRVDLILDGGPTDVGVESTVVDLSGAAPVVLRPGAIAIETLRDVVPDVREHVPAAVRADQAHASPGLLATHYAPRAPLTIYAGPIPAALDRLLADAREAGARGQRVGILAAADDVPRIQRADLSSSRLFVLGPRSDDATIASRLYAGLRALDADADVILSLAFDGSGGLWPALRDRLRRASARVVTV